MRAFAIWLMFSVTALGTAGCAAELSGGRGDARAAGDGPLAAPDRGAGVPAADAGAPPPADRGPLPPPAGDGAPPLGPQDGAVLAPPDAPRAPDLSPLGSHHVCPATALSGATALAKYDSFFDQRGRPQTDADMGWTVDPSFVTVLETVRFGDLPAASLVDLETLRTAVDFIPQHHNQTTQSNLTLFQTRGLTESPDAYAEFNPRDFIPATFTRYGGAITASAFVAKANNPWTQLALARCPDCIDGIVTLAAVPADQEIKQHDFFKIFEVRYVTDLAVDASTAAARMQAGSGKVFVSKPFKVIAALDSSGAVQTHISSLFRPFQSAALKPYTIRYRGEIGDHMYNLIQTGDAKKVNPQVTGTVALLIRYSEVNDLPLESVCPAQPVPTGVDPSAVCNVTDWGLWRCGSHGPQGQDAEQVCKHTAEGFRWLTNSFPDCAKCKVDLYKGCSYAP